MGAPRRAFWEAFAERAFGAAPTRSAEAEAEALIAATRDGATTSGRVTSWARAGDPNFSPSRPCARCKARM